MKPTPAEAAREFESILEAKGSLLGFSKKLAIEPEPALHHCKLIEKLQQIIDGTLRRLMVFMPPGSAKSTYCSVLLPPFTGGWVLQSGLNPCEIFGLKRRFA